MRPKKVDKFKIPLAKNTFKLSLLFEGFTQAPKILIGARKSKKYTFKKIWQLV